MNAEQFRNIICDAIDITMNDKTDIKMHMERETIAFSVRKFAF